MIFDRWIMAADVLGAAAGGYVSNTSLSEVALTLEACGEGSLAESLRQDGPVVLARLPHEAHQKLSEKVEPTLKPSTRIFLQSEAIEMERALGRDEPVRLVIAGQTAWPHTLKRILDREFRDQRGLGLLLTRPEMEVFKLLNQRHQLLWLEPAALKKRPRVEGRTKLSRIMTQQPGTLFDFKTLAHRHLLGEGFSSFCSRDFFALYPGDHIRIGGLSLAAQDPLGEEEILSGVDVLLAGGTTLFHHVHPVNFAMEAEEVAAPKIQPLSERVQVFLGPARSLYATLDYDPRDKTISVSLKRSASGHLISRTQMRQHKEDRIHAFLRRMRAPIQEDLGSDILPHLKGPHKRRRAREQASAVVSHVLPNALRYLTWLEAHPESTGPERTEKLALIEEALMADLPEHVSKNRDLARRDLYRTFEAFLENWGAQPKI